MPRRTFLRGAGADPNVAGRFGRTVLFVATDINTLDANPRPPPRMNGKMTPVDQAGRRWTSPWGSRISEFPTTKRRSANRDFGMTRFSHIYRMPAGGFRLAQSLP